MLQGPNEIKSWRNGFKLELPRGEGGWKSELKGQNQI
jgi:hypothetical protein